MFVLNGTAPEHADRASTEWRAAVHAQQSATTHHSGFYLLAADLVDTLRSLVSLSTVLARQVDRYDVGRDLYDDSGSIDARERLDLAVAGAAGPRVCAGQGEPSRGPVPLGDRSYRRWTGRLR